MTEQQLPGMESRRIRMIHLTVPDVTGREFPHIAKACEEGHIVYVYDPDTHQCLCQIIGTQHKILPDEHAFENWIEHGRRVVSRWERR